MSLSNAIELDEFDEMAFGLGASSTNSFGGGTSTQRMDDSLGILNSREPPQLRVAAKTSSASSAPATRIPLDGLFSDDEDDNLFPAFGNESRRSEPSRQLSVTDRPATTIPARDSFSSRLGLEEEEPPTRPVTSTVTAPRTNTADMTSGLAFGRPASARTVVPSVPEPTAATTALAIAPAGIATLASRAPVRSSLFRNLAAPPWDRPSGGTASLQPAAPVVAAVSPSTGVTAATSTSASAAPPGADRAEAERQRRSMLFGGTSTTVRPSAAAAESSASEGAQPVPSTPATSADPVVNKLLQDIREAEDEDHKRVTGHHEFIRQQTQQAAHLQQQQADEFLKVYLAENKRQLDAHLHRLRTGLPLTTNAAAAPDLPTGETVIRDPAYSERKVAALERRLEEREEYIRRYADQILALEEQHWEDMRQLREKQEDAALRTAQAHHEYVMTLQANHEAVRRQNLEAMEAMREALASKNGIDAVRSTVEQSAHDLAFWRTELEHKHEMALREKEGELQQRNNQIRELANLVERQNESFKIERESLLKRLDEDSKRLIKRESDIEEQAYALQRERLEFDTERNKFRHQQTKELQRLERRMEEVLQEKQTVLENLAEEKHVVESDKRKLADTVRAIEDKYALELKKKQLNLESAMEAVTTEKRLWEEKTANIERETAAIRAERTRLELDKQEFHERKTRQDKVTDELARREYEVEQNLLKAMRAKHESERALNEARLMDEEHRTRVTKLNGFLEQLRDRELTLMRQAVENNVLATTDSRTRLGNRSSVKVQLLPNPAKEAGDSRIYWPEEQKYIQALQNTPWVNKGNM